MICHALHNTYSATITQPTATTIMLSKDLCSELQSSCDIRPSDVCGLPDRFSPKAMFAYIRAVASTTQLPVAVVSPLFSLQVRLGRNRVPNAGVTAHSESKAPSFYVVPFPLIPAGHEDGYNANSVDIRWVRHSSHITVIM